jgi:hypothetical protein
MDLQSVSPLSIPNPDTHSDLFGALRIHRVRNRLSDRRSACSQNCRRSSFR